ncbi:hypothetical protein KQI38_09235 [Tissierella carlieri]|uniref:hypothetical protein n=1 Tax=Tissierella carlieri TaxID=689904 RepID=UPI001C1234EA|nr:hypothetical protein [Tissierella carlieri]MBU5312209.1 hypothetical protein [Tissierella carlieri]
MSVFIYEKVEFTDHITERPGAYREVPLPDGSILHVPDEGEILEEGTPVNARTLGQMDNAIYELSKIIGEIISNRNSIIITENPPAISDRKEEDIYFVITDKRDSFLNKNIIVTDEPLSIDERDVDSYYFVVTDKKGCSVSDENIKVSPSMGIKKV